VRQDLERLETELARKEREIEEEREGKENALTQLKAMMEVWTQLSHTCVVWGCLQSRGGGGRQVLKLIKTKYYAELETKKKTASEIATLRERLEQRDAEQQQQRTGNEDKKGKKSAQELEDALKNSKRYTARN
jgi:DnaJ-domain-containing protein 1